MSKLPAYDQKNYSHYITSKALKADPSSRWDKFWHWIESLHESAVQESMINLCDKPAVSRSGGNSSLQSGITCNTTMLGYCHSLALNLTLTAI